MVAVTIGNLKSFACARELLAIARTFRETRLESLIAVPEAESTPRFAGSWTSRLAVRESRNTVATTHHAEDFVLRQAGGQKEQGRNQNQQGDELLGELESIFS